MTPPAPCRVALTGGLASGKSSVARLLASHGVAVVDSDALVHRSYRPGSPGAEEVRRLFGDAVLDPSGAVDRQRLGRVVLADDTARRRLEAAIHPLVFDAVDREIAGLARGADPPGIVVVDVPLLFEIGAEGRFDLVVTVWCPADRQIERAAARGVARDRARALLAAQLPRDEKRRRADVVVDNSGPIEHLDAEVRRVEGEIRRRCRERREAAPPSR